MVHRMGDHPIHAGLPRAWMAAKIEVYTYARGPAEDLRVLSWAEDPATQTRWPIEWTVDYGKGRVYNSTFGHVWRDESNPPGMQCAGVPNHPGSGGAVAGEASRGFSGPGRFPR